MFWNELSISPVFVKPGVITHFIGIQKDVTARINLEHRLVEERDKRKDPAYRVVLNDLRGADLLRHHDIVNLKCRGPQDVENEKTASRLRDVAKRGLRQRRSLAGGLIYLQNRQCTAGKHVRPVQGHDGVGDLVRRVRHAP